jgi:Pentapeptide repeats (8 copies)
MLIGPSADLPDAPLTGANLVGIDLAGANLSGAHLASSNLTGANLSKVNLTTTKARPIAPSEASWLAASGHVRVTLTGQSIKAVVAYCAWKTAAKEFSRVVKIPKGIKTGKARPYYITVAENGGFGFKTAPPQPRHREPGVRLLQITGDGHRRLRHRSAASSFSAEWRGSNRPAA